MIPAGVLGGMVVPCPQVVGKVVVRIEQHRPGTANGAVC